MKSDDFAEDKVAQVQEAEERAKGSIKFEIVAKYLSSVESWFMVLAVLLALVASQGCATVVDYWLSYW